MPKTRARRRKENEDTDTDTDNDNDAGSSEVVEKALIALGSGLVGAGAMQVFKANPTEFALKKEQANRAYLQKRVDLLQGANHERIALQAKLAQRHANVKREMAMSYSPYITGAVGLTAMATRFFDKRKEMGRERTLGNKVYVYLGLK